jgi:hypothetical protein
LNPVSRRYESFTIKQTGGGSLVVPYSVIGRHPSAYTGKAKTADPSPRKKKGKTTRRASAPNPKDPVTPPPKPTLAEIGDEIDRVEQEVEQLESDLE